MRRLIVFNSVSMDGYFTDANNEMNFAHRDTSQDAEWNAFVAGNSSGEGTLLLGRVTYDLMASYWPTAEAAKSMPEVAEGMNNLPKIVFSRKMDKASWKNTKLVKDDMVGEVQKLKKGSGEDIVILGSGSIVSQLTQHGLIDEYQMVMIPIVLGKGRTMFDGINKNLPLKLVNSRTFDNGNVVLSYEPVKS